MAKIGTSAAAQGKRTAYVNANVLDGTEGMEVLENYAVVVEGRRIVDVAPQSDVDLSGCETFDLKGAFCFQASLTCMCTWQATANPRRSSAITRRW